MKELYHWTGFATARKIEGVPGGWEYEFTDGGWTHQPPGVTNIISAYKLNEYIDLAGLSIDDLTVFIRGIALEYDGFPSTTDALPGDGITVVVAVTDVPISANELLPPGVPYSKTSFQNLAMFAADHFTVTQDTASWGQYPVLTQSIRTSGMKATASDRLYVSIFLSAQTKVSGEPPLSTVTSFTWPAFHVKALVDVKEEPEYQYLMRLKRSYELQNEPDRD